VHSELIPYNMSFWCNDALTSEVDCDFLPESLSLKFRQILPLINIFRLAKNLDRVRGVVWKNPLRMDSKIMKNLEKSSYRLQKMSSEAVNCPAAPSFYLLSIIDDRIEKSIFCDISGRKKSQISPGTPWWATSETAVFRPATQE